MAGGGILGVKINRAIRKLIPPLRTEELAALHASIDRDGCRDPLVVWLETDELLDGHHRYAYCTKHRAPFDTTELSFPSKAEAHEWVLRNQLARRNLTDAQRVQVSLQLEEVLAPEARKRKQEGGKSAGRGRRKVSTKSSKPINTRKAVAEAAGVSEDTVSKVKRVLADGDEETKEAMLNGEVSINKAEQKVNPKKTRKKKKQLKLPTDVEALEQCVAAINQAIDKTLKTHPTIRPMVISMLRDIRDALQEEQSEQAGHPGRA